MKSNDYKSIRFKRLAMALDFFSPIIFPFSLSLFLSSVVDVVESRLMKVGGGWWFLF